MTTIYLPASSPHTRPRKVSCMRGRSEDYDEHIATVAAAAALARFDRLISFIASWDSFLGDGASTTAGGGGGGAAGRG